ncbi:1,4-dihydroxy-2-naphthoate octaprenyltransferase [Psittacicella gerlachiana]|uniref:1,4-dihydroxy-2-naphthoate octaprenyltransferase n=1 Tax=Psittacicella gerlachiana TaxID=2028574 RepID=A0A3A1YQN2_9GAMM|nr:1,4-dihydroxy-2-naphthoate octaprenyltransferase [Psittacicella gerlachiana]RIY38684.1 1,4-dihydroxy-2-naphthoate octaprenyltransferase [Psittacicella gerlachiana]
MTNKHSFSEANKATDYTHKHIPSSLDEGIDDIATLATASKTDILFKNINPTTVREAYRDERVWRLKFKKAYLNNPNWFVIYNLINPYSLVKTVLAVLLGTSLALLTRSEINWGVFTLCLVLAILVQLFANLCKEYSSENLGTKYECRLCEFEAIPGEKIISRRTVLQLTKITAVAILASCIGLVFLAGLSLGSTLVFAGLIIIILNLLMRYSIGSNPYNFTVLGELSYFLVYGVVMVDASFYLQVHDFDIYLLFPALAFGFLCVATLNLFNMRDSYVARAYHKDNLAVVFGTKASRLFQTTFYLLALIFYSYFNTVIAAPWFCYLFFISTPLIAFHLYVIHTDASTKALNNQKYIANLINIVTTGTFIITTVIAIYAWQ